MFTRHATSFPQPAMSKTWLRTRIVTSQSKDSQVQKSPGRGPGSLAQVGSGAHCSVAFLLLSFSCAMTSTPSATTSTRTSEKTVESFAAYAAKQERRELGLPFVPLRGKPQQGFLPFRELALQKIEDKEKSKDTPPMKLYSNSPEWELSGFCSC